MALKFEEGGSSTAQHETVGVYRCPNCGKDNEPHYEFCLGCGQQLVATRGPSTLPDFVATQETTSVVGRSSKKAIWFLVALAAALLVGGAVLIKLAIS